MGKGKRTAKIRKIVGDALRRYRLLTRQTVAQVAKELGWSDSEYAATEAGLIGRSKGQQEDVRRLIQKAIAKSAQAEVHYPDVDTRDEGTAITACGTFPSGDRIADPSRPGTVTCGKCRLTPKWARAMGTLVQVLD